MVIKRDLNKHLEKNQSNHMVMMYSFIKNIHINAEAKADELNKKIFRYEMQYRSTVQIENETKNQINKDNQFQSKQYYYPEQFLYLKRYREEDINQ